VVQTPTFDRIAREGVLFTRAHVIAPTCTAYDHIEEEDPEIFELMRRESFASE